MALGNLHTATDLEVTIGRDDFSGTFAFVFRLEFTGSFHFAFTISVDAIESMPNLTMDRWRELIRELYRYERAAILGDDVARRHANMTLTEIRHRELQLARHPLLHYASTGDLDEVEYAPYIAANDIVPYFDSTLNYSNYVKAQKRSWQLLLENLSERERVQLAQKKYFTVKGGTTGRIYAITKRTSFNVLRLKSQLFSNKYRYKESLCFQPSGPSSRWEGDVMLAQKIALEHFERRALAVANISRYSENDWKNEIFYHG